MKSFDKGRFSCYFLRVSASNRKSHILHDFRDFGQQVSTPQKIIRFYDE
jgi:hypothetical protein